MRGVRSITFSPTRFEVGRPMLIAGLSERYGSDCRAEIPTQWARFAPYIGAVENQVGASAFGAVSFLPDGFEYMTGVHVWDADELPAGFSVLRIPARRYAVFMHEGHVSTLADTVQPVMHEWLPRSGLALASPPELTEVYGEGFNLTSGRGGVEIWVAVADSDPSTYGRDT